MNDKLEDISNRIGNENYMGGNDEKAVSELTDEIRTAITDGQVSSEARTGSGI